MFGCFLDCFDYSVLILVRFCAQHFITHAVNDKIVRLYRARFRLLLSHFWIAPELV